MADRTNGTNRARDLDRLADLDEKIADINDELNRGIDDELDRVLAMDDLTNAERDRRFVVARLAQDDAS